MEPSDSASVLFTSYEDGSPAKATFLGSLAEAPEPIEVTLTPTEASMLSALIIGIMLSRGESWPSS